MTVLVDHVKYIPAIWIELEKWFQAFSVAERLDFTPKRSWRCSEIQLMT